MCVNRHEDSAPRARRRRRYGRGPNTYTRNWQDETAYSKPGGTAGAPGIKIDDTSEASIIHKIFNLIIEYLISFIRYKTFY